MSASPTMSAEEIATFDRRVPRYTSYPTAPHFGPAVDDATYRRWLGKVPREAALSLYLHVPFCRRLCWFCGCTTAVVNRYQPVAAYLETLEAEIALVADALGERRPVAHVHWGGGSPTMLEAADFARLMETVRTRFDLVPEAEVAVEIDPRGISASLLDAFAAAGVTRASLGVQDFDPAVQRAINRLQPFEMTREVVEGLRARGINALNLDLLYGLPHQSADGIAASVELALALAPDRVALFGYAHVPWMKRHQRLIDEAALPDAVERVRQAQAAAAALTAGGLVEIGLDHFAQPGDALAVAARAGRLRRNFQGYTTDEGAVLLGLGASAIGTLDQGYVQNAATTPDYRTRIAAGRLATVRGVATSADDRLRRALIERLMCDLAVDVEAVCAAHGTSERAVADAKPRLAALAADGVVDLAWPRVRVRHEARLLVRLACAAFDSYLDLAPATPRHASAV